MAACSCLPSFRFSDGEGRGFCADLGWLDGRTDHDKRLNGPASRAEMRFQARRSNVRGWTMLTKNPLSFDGVHCFLAAVRGRPACQARAFAGKGHHGVIESDADPASWSFTGFRETSSCVGSATSFLDRRPGSRARPAPCRPGFRRHERDQAMFPLATIAKRSPAGTRRGSGMKGPWSWRVAGRRLQLGGPASCLPTPLPTQRC